MATKTSNLQELYQALQTSHDYREFLAVYLELKSLSLADFARQTGFARGFPSDVLKGKRRLSLKSYAAFEKALRLPAMGRKLFRFLVAKEEADLFPDLHAMEVKQGIEHLRRTSWQSTRRTVHEIESKSARSLIENSNAMAIYAASGEPGKGATLEEIRNRTRISKKDIEIYVEQLKTLGFLESVDEKLMPKDLHLFVQTYDQSKLLANTFRKAAENAAARIHVLGGKSDQEMFFCSNFCVAESSLPELKVALRETILKFVDNSIHPSGDRLVKLVTALHL